mgnify:FL=1
MKSWDNSLHPIFNLAPLFEHFLYSRLSSISGEKARKKCSSCSWRKTCFVHFFLGPSCKVFLRQGWSGKEKLEKIRLSGKIAMTGAIVIATRCRSCDVYLYLSVYVPIVSLFLCFVVYGWQKVELRPRSFL